MMSRFEDQDQDKAKDDQQEQEDTFPPAGILLVPVLDRQYSLTTKTSQQEVERTDLVASPKTLTASSICTAVC